MACTKMLASARQEVDARMRAKKCQGCPHRRCSYQCNRVPHERAQHASSSSIVIALVFQSAVVSKYKSRVPSLCHVVARPCIHVRQGPAAGQGSALRPGIACRPDGRCRARRCSQPARHGHRSLRAARAAAAAGAHFCRFASMPQQSIPRRTHAVPVCRSIFQAAAETKTRMPTSRVITPGHSLKI